MNFIKRFLFLVFVIFFSAITNLTWADNILNIRGFSNQDKTRVVFDLDFKPTYSTALSDDNSVFIIRIKNVDNYKTAKSTLAMNRKGAVVGFNKKLDKKDVRYVFSIEGTTTPNVFVLAPQGKNPYRLVVDFPHTSVDFKKSPQGDVQVLDKKTAQSLKGSGAGSVGLPPTKVVTIKDADHAEQDLLNSLSSVGSDGIRTMTPAQVEAYEQKLLEIRRVQAQNTEGGVEEEVLETQAPPPPLEIKSNPDPFIVAIDAGHGGKDPGAIGKRGVKEKNVTLSIATELARYINSNKQFRGKLIRSKDVFVDLDDRSRIARKYKADILISIHADSVASGSKARGASVWVLADNRAKRENNKILQKKGKTSSSDLLGGAGDIISQNKQNPFLAATILDMTSDNARSEGYTLGEEILDRLGKFTKLHNKKPIPASLAVLISPDIPSLLIETGFLSNPYEEIKLNQPNYQKQIAYCIYQGIVQYYTKYPAQMYKSRQESAIRANSSHVHIVKKGEYLSKIAAMYGVSVSTLKKHNNLKSDVLKVGQSIAIP